MKNVTHVRQAPLSLMETVSLGGTAAITHKTCITSSSHLIFKRKLTRGNKLLMTSSINKIN